MCLTLRMFSLELVFSEESRGHAFYLDSSEYQWVQGICCFRRCFGLQILSSCFCCYLAKSSFLWRTWEAAGLNLPRACFDQGLGAAFLLFKNALLSPKTKDHCSGSLLLPFCFKAYCLLEEASLHSWKFCQIVACQGCSQPFHQNSSYALLPLPPQSDQAECQQPLSQCLDRSYVSAQYRVHPL